MSLSYLETYINLFVGRTDDYAKQLPTGGYVRVGKELTPADVQDHLQGRASYGTYVMAPDGTCRFGVFDADSSDGLSMLLHLQERLEQEGIASSLESSRRGGHLWVFLAQPTPASQVRAWLMPWCPSYVEFYPKQSEGKGYGSLIRLPLGVHRKSGQSYPFVTRTSTGLHPLTATEQERATWMASIQRVRVPKLSLTPARKVPATCPTVSAPMSSSGGPSSIREWNAQQDPFEMIGKYIQLNASGVGCCPFGEHHPGGTDRQASFKVYRPGVAGGYCWYCYTWQQGGSVFDFLRYYYHLDAATLWRRIREQETTGEE